MDQQEKSYKQPPGSNSSEDHPSMKDYYEVLQVEKNATFKEIREAYFRLKNTYDSNNQALYSLLEEGDLEESLDDINQAYAVIGNEASRVAYDRDLVAANLATEAQLCPDIYVDCVGNKLHSSGPSRASGASAAGWEDDYHDMGFGKGIDGAHSFQEELGRGQRPRANYGDMGLHANPTRRYGVINNSVRKAIAPAALDSDIQEKVSQAIEDGDLGDGNLYKRIRQIVGVSKEEMQDHIKISIGYIDHLEENRFDLLPQPVYVKGFLKSYLRFLGVSACEHLVKAYAERLDDWIEKKSS